MRTVLLILIVFTIGVLIGASLFRQRGASTSQAMTGNTLAERELDRVLPAVDIEAMPFERAVEEIQKLTPAKITVDWKPLIEYGFDRKTSITIQGSDVFLWQIMERITTIGSRAIGADYPLQYAPRDGEIAIATAEQLRPNFRARLYDVHDLVFAAAPVTPAGFGPPPIPNASSVDVLAKLITDSVAPETWRESGGVVGSMYAANEHLYIVTDWSTHRKIQQLLRDLREGDTATLPPIVEKPWSDVHETWISPDLPEKLETLIHRPIDRVEFDAVPLDEAIEKLRNLSGANISVQWKVLADARVSRKTPVSLKMIGAPLSSTLNLFFSQPIDGIRLGFTLDDGVVEISTREEVDKVPLTRLYDVRDFIAQAKPSEREDVVGNLVKLITDTIDTDSWRDNGGTIGAIRELGGRLFVTQTWANHERIAEALGAMRKSGGGLMPMPTTQRAAPSH